MLLHKQLYVYWAPLTTYSFPNSSQSHLSKLRCGMLEPTDMRCLELAHLLVAQPAMTISQRDFFDVPLQTRR